MTSEQAKEMARQGKAIVRDEFFMAGEKYLIAGVFDENGKESNFQWPASDFTNLGPMGFSRPE